MSRLVYNCGRIVQPENVDFYLRVNPLSFEVTQCRGGYKPVDPKRWLGSLPIKPFPVKEKV